MSSRRRFEKIRRVSEASTSSGSTPRSPPAFVGILTVSDRCSVGEKSDLSGPNLQRVVQEQDGFRAVVKVYKIVPDEEDQISGTLKNWSDELGLDLIVTTGGTGLGPRDVTPEATASVIGKEATGFEIAIITASLKVTPDAMVTRLKCGVRGSTLIINVPGSKKASEECLNVVLPAIPHALECIQNKVERVCSCSIATEKYRDTSSKRKVAADRSTRPIEPIQPLGGTFRCPDGEHTLAYNPSTVISISEDDRALTDADIESILSTDENAMSFSSPTSESQETSTSSAIGKNAAINDLKTVNGEDVPVLITNTVHNLDTEESPIIDAFGRILADDIRIQQSVTVGQSSVGAGNFNLNFIAETSSQSPLRSSALQDKPENVVVKRGTLLTAYQIGIVAGQGLTACRTFKTPIVGVLSIGEKDKIIANHVTSQIYLQRNSVKMVDLGTTGHNLGLLPEVFRSAMSKADVIVVISNLEAYREMASSLITKLFQGTVHFSAIAEIPRSKSYFLSTNRNGKQNLFFIVPENPFGSTICSLALIPAYRKMAGFEDIRHKQVTAKFPLDKDLKINPEYLQCKVAGLRDGIATLETVISNEKDASRQFQYGINALAMLPPRKDARSSIQKGDTVDVLLIDVNNRS